MSIRMLAAAVITAAAMVVALCGSAVAAVAATSRAASPAVQLTGVQLLSALLPRSDFPAGYTLEEGTAVDSGRHLEKSPAKYHLSTVSCSSFGNNFSGTGFGESATASDAFANSNDTDSFVQVVYQFRTRSAANSFFSGMLAIAHRCRSFVIAGASDVLTHVFNAPRIGGHRTFQVNQSGSFSSIVVAVDSVITVAGTDLFFTANAGVNAAPPGSPPARTTMFRLIKRVEAFR